MYVCGWDGGGTKTEVLALDMEGRELAHETLGALNLNGNSAETIENTVKSGLALLHTLPGGMKACAALVIGTAGLSNTEAIRSINALVEESGFEGKFILAGDQEIALEGAIDGAGAVLVAGTGAICSARGEHGERTRVGGFGYLVDDLGSGYAIGRDILVTVLRTIDGRNEQPTVMSDLLAERTGLKTSQEIVTWMYRPDWNKKDVAALAPILLDAIEAGDPYAIEIAEKAGDDLSELAITAFRKLNIQSGELAFIGSILNRYELVRKRVIEKVHAVYPDICIHSPKGTAAQGAAWMALKSVKE